jgi:hypothetical protein
VGLYLSTKDLWPTAQVSLSTIRSTAASFEPLDLLFMLAQVGIALRDDYTLANSPVERALLRQLVPEVELRKIALWLDSGRAARVIHRLLLPAAIATVLASEGEPGAGHTTVGHEHAVGRMLLDLNAVLEDDIRPDLLTHAHEKPNRWMAASILRNLFYSHHENLGCAIARSWLLFQDGMQAVEQRYPAEAFDFCGAFERTFAFPYRDLVALVFAMYGKYEGLRSHAPKELLDWCVGAGYFTRSLNARAAQTVPRIFSYLSRSFEGHAQAIRASTEKHPETLLQLFPLYDRPLLELQPDVFVPLDMGYLSRVLSEAPFWRLLKALNDSRQDREAHQLKAALGRAVEWYVAALLRPASRRPTTRGLWVDWERQVPGRAGIPTPDALLLEDGVLFVLELTARALTPQVTVSCDPDQIESGIQRLWFGDGDDGGSGKLRQLERAWRAIRAGDLPVSGVDRATRVVPILLSLRYAPQNPLLLRWFTGLMQAEGLDEEFIRSLIFLDVPDLERLMVLNTAGRSWGQVLDSFRGSAYAAQGFANYLFYTSRQTDRNPLLAATLDRMPDMFIDTLFTKELADDHRRSKDV